MWGLKLLSLIGLKLALLLRKISNEHLQMRVDSFPSWTVFILFSSTVVANPMLALTRRACSSKAAMQCSVQR